MYATVEDLQSRISRDLTADEQALAATLLEDAAVFIDACNQKASDDAKKIVSCRMVIRALGDGSDYSVPLGATQGTMSALGYSQTWAVPSGGSYGELYLSKADKMILGRDNNIGSYSPIQELVRSYDD